LQIPARQTAYQRGKPPRQQCQADDADIDIALLEDAVVDEQGYKSSKPLRRIAQAPMSSIAGGGTSHERRRAGNNWHAGAPDARS
jgi:hypothetical protein